VGETAALRKMESTPDSSARSMREMRLLRSQYRTWLIAIVLLALLTGDLYELLSGLDWKTFWRNASIAITLVGYAFYIWQMYPPDGTPPVKPEPISWTLFGILTAAGWVVQVAQGAGAGSWCLGITAGACFIIAGWSYLKFSWTFDRFHIIVVFLALALFAFSAATSQEPTMATASAILATLADFVSYGPTFRKAWYHPREDSITNFVFNSVKCVPALLAIESYSIATTVYLIMLWVVNGGFAVFLAIRRRRR